MKEAVLQTKVVKFVVTIILFSAGLAANAASVPNYYRCTNPTGGEWAYGRAPQACEVAQWGEDSVVYQDYNPVIFSDMVDKTGERARYMQELNAVIRDAALYYMKQRKPSVAQAELDYWVLGIMTTASQESYWSHYRFTTDQKVKYMRGDYGHGHGMMQVDDRSHFAALEAGAGWNLGYHLAYAMDIFYKNWENAPKQSCVGSATNYIARIRSAWAAYNGGPSKLCRWTNSFDSYAQNDKNFNSQLTNRRWQQYVANANMASKVDIGCLMDKGSNCSQPNPNPVPVELVDGVLYSVSDARACVLHAGLAYCVAEQRDRLCLKSVQSFDAEKSSSVSAEQIAKHSPQTLDRHTLCAQYDSTLYKVGDAVKVKKTINIRQAPGTGIVGTVPANSVVTITDFEIRDASVNDRYYKIQYGKISGYIFAGNKTDYMEWAVLNDPTSPTTPPTSVAKVNQSVQVVISGGINMRATPGGKQQTVVASKAVVAVLEVIVQGADNDIYYKVNYKGFVGYIYSGKLLPQDTVKTWTIIKD